MAVKSLNINRSLFFLLPLIAEQGKSCEDYTGDANYATSNSDRVLDGFIIDHNDPEKDNHLTIKVDLMFDISSNQKYRDIFKLLVDSDNFDGKKDYHINGKTDTYIHMELPAMYEGIHNAIRKGNFDMLPKKLTIKILLFWGLQSSAEIFEYATSSNDEMLPNEEAVKIEDVYSSRHNSHALERITKAIELQNMQSVIDE